MNTFGPLEVEHQESLESNIISNGLMEVMDEILILLLFLIWVCENNLIRVLSV